MLCGIIELKVSNPNRCEVKTMSEKSLYKLFYSDPAAYQAEYEKRFHHADTMHLPISIGKHPAFLWESPKILRQMLSIERANLKVHQLCSKLPGIAILQFQQKCMIDEIVLTNHIEGVQSTRKEISEILHDLSRNEKHRRFTGLVNQYTLLMQNQEISVVTPKDIRNLYDAMFYEEIKAADPDDLPDGELFRKNAVSVYSPTGKEIHRGAYPERQIICMMEQALEFLNNESYDYLVRISVFHYLFGYIHPFYDGNGRTDRFISSYLLSKQLNNLIGYRISFTVRENIREYYEAFKICNHYTNKGDLTPFVEMFLHIIELSMQQLVKALESRQEKFLYYRQQIQKLPGAERERMRKLYYILMQAALFSGNGISQKELEESMGVSYNTVRRHLKQIPENLLLVNKLCNRAFYLLNLEAVDNLDETLKGQDSYETV